MKVRLNDGKTNDFKEVTSLEVKENRLLITIDGSVQIWNLPDCDIDVPFKGAPLGIRNDIMFLSIENYDQDLLKKILSKKGGFLHLLENNKKYILPALALALFSYWVLFTFILPAASNSIAKNLPPYYGQKVDENIVENLNRYGMKDSSLTEETKDEVKTYLLKNTPEDFKNVRILFKRLDTPIPNAFALAGNVVVLSDQIINKLNSKEQVLAIYLHELGHLHGRHLLKTIINGLSLGIISYLTIGDLPGGTESLATLALTFIGLSYDRDHEREADDFALAQHKLRNLNPICFSEGLSRIEEAAKEFFKDEKLDSVTDSKIFEYLSTHPQSDERIKKFGSPDSSEKSGCKNTLWNTVRVSPLLLLKEEETEKSSEESIDKKTSSETESSSK